MRITEIQITNYKAFYGTNIISLDKEGKNLMLYGENGSGKSSLYIALQRFFQSSVAKVNVEENIFVSTSQKDTASIKLTIKESPESSKTTSFELNINDKKLISDDKLIISDANKIRGFFDYRSLLKTHLYHKEQVNLFEILVEDILYNAENRFTRKELGAEWKIIKNDTNKKRQTHRIKEAIKGYVEKFNDGLKEKIQSIEEDTNTFLKYFGINIKLKLKYDGIVYHGRRDLRNTNIGVIIDFYNTEIPKHQFFLNEARLSALAISLYLASIKANPAVGKLKLLVLDDLLIGLDMSNRIPLLEILKDHFVEVKKDEQFQIIMTTYDKVWYELVKNYFGETDWKYVEIYSKSLKDEDFEIPIIHNSEGFLDRANFYLTEKDYKASAVYIRTEFERLVKNICEKKSLDVLYKKNQKEIKSDDFWKSVVFQTDIEDELIKKIEIHRGVVMNPFSHYDLEKPEFKVELENTIKAVKELKDKVPLIKKKVTITDLKKEIEKLKKKIENKDKTIKKMKEKLNPDA